MLYTHSFSLLDNLIHKLCDVYHPGLQCKDSISLLHSSGKFHFSIDRWLDQVLKHWLNVFWETFSSPTGAHTIIWSLKSMSPFLGGKGQVHSDNTFLHPLLSDVGLYGALPVGCG